MNGCIYIAEAYKDGQRIERIAHTSYEGAKEDIEVSTSLDDPDEITIDEERLYLGQDDVFHIER